MVCEAQKHARTVDLCRVTSTLHADADVDVLEPVAAEEQDWLEHLQAESLGLHQLNGATVDLHHA